MADSEYITLVASTVATITLDNQYSAVEVVNLTGTAPVYFTIDGTTPTIKGAGTLVLPAVIGGTDIRPSPTVLKFISPGAPEIYVRGV